MRSPSLSAVVRRRPCMPRHGYRRRLIIRQVYLDKENPTAFRIFFDSSGRRKSFIAPERFLKGGTGRKVESLRPEMDVFSAGCVLAELFSDGSSVLMYSDLGRCSDAFLRGVDERVRTLVAQMVSEDPACRPTSGRCLELFLTCCEGVASSTDFDIMETLCQDWCHMIPSVRVSAALERTGQLLKPSMGPITSLSPDNSNANDGSTRGEAMPHCDVGGIEDVGAVCKKSRVAVGEVRVIAAQLTGQVRDIMGRYDAPAGPSPSTSPSPTMVAPTLPREGPCPSGTPLPPGLSTFVAQILTITLAALVRSTDDASSKLMLLDLMRMLSVQIGQRLVDSVVLPHFVVAATDKQAQQPRVQYFALTSLPEIMKQSNSDHRVVADYIMPALSLVPSDADVAVRCAYSVSIGRILREGSRDDGFEGDCGHNRGHETDGQVGHPCELVERIRGGVERGVHDILVDASSLPKLALLKNLDDVALGLGPELTMEGLLPALLTLFNSRQDDVRASMYGSLEGIIQLLGSDVVPFILPFVDRLVSGPDVRSIVSGMRLLAAVIEGGFLAPKDVLRIVERVRSLASSRSPSIQGGLSHLKDAASKILGADVTGAVLLLSHTPGRPAQLDIDRCVMRDAGDSFLMPTNPACYSVDMTDGTLDHLINNNTKASTIASPSLLTSPSFRKKRVGPMIFPSISNKADIQRRTGPGAGSPIRASWRQAGPPAPAAALVASIPCHAKAITCVSENIGSQSTIFVTSSKDGTCKLWDTRKLERDITFRARATFFAADRGALDNEKRESGERCDLKGYGCCAASLEASWGSSFLGGRVDGIVDAWNVERDACPVDYWRIADNADILDICLGSCGKICIASTAAQSVVGIDPRLQKGLAWGVHTEPCFGVPMRIGTQTRNFAFPDPSFTSPSSSATPYFVAATSRGYLTVWDTRFMLPVATWRNPASAPISAINIVDGSRLGAVGTASSSPPPTTWGGPIALISCGEEEISGWDLATGDCVLAMARGEHPRALKSSVMNTAKPAEDPVGLARQMGALDLRSLSIKRTTIRAMTLVAGEDDAGCLSVLSGGTDQTISLWNPRMRRGSNVSSVFTSPAAHDSVTALRHVRGAGAKFLLASASADGMMNVWK